jgi:tRNA/rRNA methyltransferase
LETGNIELASRESLALLQDRSKSLFQEIDYPKHKVEYALLMVRRILGRAELTEREARTLLGIIKRIRWRIGCLTESDTSE